MNQDGTIYICRWWPDQEAYGAPAWLSDWELTVKRAYLADLTELSEYMRCYSKHFSKTKRNYYGGLDEDPIMLYTNGVSGNEEYMYMALVVPDVDDEEDGLGYSSQFTLSVFWARLMEYLPMLVIFFSMTKSYMHKIGWRADLIESHILKLAMRKDHILRHLFIGYGASDRNVEFRRNLFFCRCAVQLSLAMPLITLWAWGFSTIITVNPPAVGFFILLASTAFLVGWYGFKFWKVRGWLMGKASLLCFGTAILLVVCYCAATVFVDPAVYDGGEPLNFTGVTSIFFTLELLPLIFLLFVNDAKLKRSIKKLPSIPLKLLWMASSFTHSLNHSQSCFHCPTFVCQADPEAMAQQQEDNVMRELQESNPYSRLLGDGYTALPSIAVFKWTTALTAGMAVRDHDGNKRRNRQIYYLSLLCLAVYQIISITDTDYPELALVNIITLNVLNSVHYSLHRGAIYWTPGFSIMLMGLARLCMMASMAQYWLFGYSLAFIVYGSALVQEVVRVQLPSLTAEEAGAIAYAGHDPSELKCNDLAANPELVLGYSSAYYIFILVFLAYAKPESLPQPTVPVGGQDWPIYIFGVISFLVVIASGLFVATSRSFSLLRQGLLSPELTQAFLWHPSIRLPMILAISSMVLVVISGLLIWAATGSSAVFTICLFTPAIILTGTFTYKSWKANDYELVWWPPNAARDKLLGVRMEGDPEDDDEPSNDERMAQGMMSTLQSNGFGGGAGGGLGGGLFGGFQLPNFSVTGGTIRGPSSPAGSAMPMPALPLKSALAKKRGAENSSGGDNGMQVGNGEAKALLEKKKKKLMTRRKMVRSEDEELGYWTARGVALSAWIRKGGCCKSLKVPHELSAEALAASSNGVHCSSLTPFQAKAALKYGKVGVDGDGDDEQEKDPESGDGLVADLPFWRAVLEGYLLPHEFQNVAAFALLCTLIPAMGLVLATEEPGWIGMVAWMGTYVVLFTSIPLLKWHATFRIDDSMKACMTLAGCTHTILCLLTFLFVLDAKPYTDNSLAVLNAFIGFPLLAHAVHIAGQARDGQLGNNISKDDDEYDDEPTAKDRVKRFLAAAIGCKLRFTAAMLLWLWQAFVWGNSYLGTSLTLLTAVGVIALFMMKDYARNNYTVNGKYLQLTLGLFQVSMAAALVAGVTGIGSEAFCLSVFFLLWMARLAVKLVLRIYEVDADTPVYFSSWVLPVYTYDARSDNLSDETVHALRFYAMLLVGVCWGIILAIFVSPMSIGIIITCFFLIALATTTASAVSHAPACMANASQFLSQDVMQAAATAAKANFQQRHSELKMECLEWDQGDQYSTEHSQPHNLPNWFHNQVFQARATAAQLAQEVETETKSLHVAFGKMMRWLAWPVNLTHSLLVLGSNSSFACRGPVGVVGLWGLWYKLITMALKELAHFTAAKRGNHLNNLLFLPLPYHCLASKLNSSCESITSCTHSPSNPTAFALQAYYEELRCMIHFQTLILLAAEARLQREATFFRKFLKENHFKLLSNGIAPPKNIFSSNSFSTINAGMVAVWLCSLTREERERFHMLKHKFTELQTDRDMAIDEADLATVDAAEELEYSRREREQVMANKRAALFERRRRERMEEWLVTLSQGEIEQFERVKTLWMKQQDPLLCHLTSHSAKHQGLREKFQKSVLLGGMESVMNARELLEEIEEKGKGCKPGEYGRKLQFVDQEFPPSIASLGEAQCKHHVAPTWKLSLSVNPDVKLYDEGTDPDDVRPGSIQDTWLLSALSMISAASVGDAEVDEQIAQLFVSHIGADGQPVHDSYTGAYAVRINKGGNWHVVLVDDFFPALDAASSDEVNKGLACAHAAGVRELWPSLLEKAYAKFYGSYGALEVGHVHHALRDFTGSEAEEIFLNTASKGVGKKSLWKKVLRFKRNGYIMGAGTISSGFAEKQVQDSGIVFGAAYTLLDAREIDGHRLLKLRNPPGDHEEWRGDWGDASSLWTRRLKHLFGYTDDESDNSFWMSFDDFCMVFRSMYVCRWYDPTRWVTSSTSGCWTMTDELDTAAGLPGEAQQSCEIESNPQFVLKVQTATDVRITLRQTDEELLPVACIVFKPEGFPSLKAPKRITRMSHDNVFTSTGNPKIQRVQHIYCTLGRGTYVVMAATYVAGMEGGFMVEVVSSSGLFLRKLWPPADEQELAALLESKGMLGKLEGKMDKALATAGDKINETGQGALDKAKAAGMERSIRKAELKKQMEEEEKEA
ncbi:unnamed protein product [Chrysoparadoxa australica]